MSVDGIRTITSEAELREIIGSPAELIVAKIADRLNGLTRQFIERSPFLSRGHGEPRRGPRRVPRGDPAGFVQILDERTLVLPERPGNRLADTLTNLLADPRIALLFLIPGVGDTFRVNGRGVITDDSELLAPCAVEGKPPRLGILVSIEEAYTQCPEGSDPLGAVEPRAPHRPLRAAQLGQILRSLTDPEFDAEEYDRERKQRYARREGLY